MRARSHAQLHPSSLGERTAVGICVMHEMVFQFPVSILPMGPPGGKDTSFQGKVLPPVSIQGLGRTGMTPDLPQQPIYP